MPSIESIGAISSLRGRAIDSSCLWLVKGMRGISCAKQRQVRASKEGKWQRISKKKKEEKELNKLFYASGIGKHDKSVLHILASSLVFQERKLQRLTEEKGPRAMKGESFLFHILVDQFTQERASVGYSYNVGLKANRAQYKRMELNLALKKSICLTHAFRSHFLPKEDQKKLKVQKEGSNVYEQNEPHIEKADQGELQLQLSIRVLRWERK
nr:hypothetical protein [Tanacetum cinerariifolium]